MTYGAMIQMRRASVAGHSLPPLSAYESWWAVVHTDPKAFHVAASPAQYRRLAALIRSGASLDEKTRALGCSTGGYYKMLRRLPEALK